MTGFFQAGSILGPASADRRAFRPSPEWFKKMLRPCRTALRKAREIDLGDSAHSFVCLVCRKTAISKRNGSQPDASSTGYAMPFAQISALRLALERRLYSFGFTLPVVRHMVCVQLMVTAAGLTLGLLFIWLSAWPLAFGAGAALATYSLWHVAKVAQGMVHLEFSAALAMRLFLGFSLRMLLIGVVLFALIVWLGAPVAPLLVGLTSAVISIALWGISRFSRKPVKEA
ncbi:hypothetical protein LJC46_07430 [Desulfovibrio sp. OttesenSCG-928-G15]|nr:hypothetical protein [Desulfovibrio sp. OttesenSCG-928-G15]